MNEDELMEAEEEFQSFLNQNSSVHIVNEAQMARAFDLPAAPEGYRYDMTKNPPELVKKKVRKTKAKAPKSESNALVPYHAPKPKPSLNS